MQNAGGDIPPNQTLYINNLNERVKKDELKHHLYAIFSQFGPIVDITAEKNFKMRGQAFVSFRDITAASEAMRQMNNFPFFDKPMRISFARESSDVVLQLQGKTINKSQRKQKKAERQQIQKQLAAKAKQQAQAAPRPPTQVSSSRAPPNNILFLENLPPECNEMMLSMLFQQYPGFKEVRLVPGKAGIAFVEFTTEGQAGVAMNGLQGFKVTAEHSMRITYAKK